MMKNPHKIKVKEVYNLETFLAGDDTTLTEVFHPKNDGLDLPYSLAFAKLDLAQKSLPHKLKNDELYIFIKGNGSIFIEDEKSDVKSGSVVLVPKMKTQYVENTGKDELHFYCIVSPPWSEEQEEILK